MTDFSPVVEDARVETAIDDLRREFSRNSGSNPNSDFQTVEVGSVEGEYATRPLDQIEYETIYNTRDGRSVRILPQMLKAKMSLRWGPAPDVPPQLVGKRVWSFDPVEDAPMAGKNQDLRCLLAEDDENRAHYTSLGIDTVCNRRGIPNKMAQRMHMERKHRSEWAIIKDEREQVEKEQEKQERLAYLDALNKAVEGRGNVDPETIAAIVEAVTAAREDTPKRGANRAKA